MNIITPIVHLNGTSMDSLISDRCDAYAAIQTALETLAKVGPNGRDFYPEPGRMDKAVAQHQRRMKVLSDLMAEIEEECRLIEEQAR